MENHKHHRRRPHLRGAAEDHLLIFQKRPQEMAKYFFMLLLAATSNFATAEERVLAAGHNLEQLRIPESQPLDSVVHQLKAVDPANRNRNFSYHMTGDTFSVDEQTGEVRLIKPLDRERQPQIVVVVSVFDNGDARSESPVETKRRTIYVEDVDDSWPIFSPHRHSTLNNPLQGQYSYQVELSELAPINSIVLAEVQVTDADEGVNAELVFECRARQSTNGACETFSLESRRLGSGKYSATIKTKSLLDYERVQSYKFALVARGRRPSPLRGAPLEAEAVIAIDLVNVQDEGPVFVNAPYSLSVHEGLRPGSRLLNLLVQDGDAAPQRELSMIVVPGPFSQYFQVTKEPESSKVWYLETNETIDRESQLMSSVGNMFTISLLAAELDESGSPVASEVELLNALREPNYSKGTLRKENVTVMVLDLPDSRPIFVHASSGKPLKDNLLTFNISESIGTGSSVPNLNLAAYDLDQGMNSRFNLSLLDSDIGPPATSVFGLETGVVYGKCEIVLNVLNSSLLDYEIPDLRVYRFNLVASKSTEPPLVQILEVQVNIMDANDNSPEFERDQYILDVPEASPPGYHVATIKAHDRDSGNFGKLDYMLRGVGASKFKLISSEGKIIVNDCGILQCLDYEVQPSFSLTYEAKDGAGRSRNVSVIINVVDVNDHEPKFTEAIYKRELISDNLSSKQNYISPQLIVKATDSDGPTQGRSNITYRLKWSNLTNLDVDHNSGLVYISQPMDLDNMISNIAAQGSAVGAAGRSVGSRRILFEAEVVAEDNGTPQLNSSAKIHLIVKSNRDGAPQFKQDLYQVSVKESQPPMKPFYQVQAIDPDDKDSQLRYSLGYDLNDLISINAVSGELSFRQRVDFDDFKDAPYNVTVQATDSSRPYPLQASAVVSISIQDVNDKAPKFELKEYKSTIVQGKSKPGELILQVSAVDLDRNAQLNYSIVASQLSVYDRNGQQFSLDDIANSTVGYLAQMNRNDRLKLVNELRSLFQIDKRTGAVTLKAEPDYTFAASIMILVRVVDLNQEVYTQTGELQQDFVPCTFLLQAHIDKSPIFAPPWSVERPEYNLSMLEELTIGTPIFSLLAKDPATNSRIEEFEKIFESDPRDLFRVERSGLVLVNRRIDFEDLPGASKRLSLSVKALSGNSYFSVANLNIRVIDLNDNAPQFKSQNYSSSISELAGYPQEILTVSAEDRDSSEFGQVHYSISGYSSDLFSIHPRRGAISIRRGAKLDRDSEPLHSLLVTASDCNETQSADPNKLADHQMGPSSGCRKSSVFVNIQLLDENDNEPVFTNVNKRGEFEALTSETVSANSVITQVRALDADEGPNSQLSYEIVRGDDQLSKLLRIDQDGYISAAESLSGLGRSSPYRVNIRAFDHGKVSKESHATLLLTVNDVVANDGVPRFLRPRADETVSLSESSGPSTFVYQVLAVDRDEETNGKLMYKFAQPSDTFEIDPFTGVIKTQSRPSLYLDREQIANYTLIVVAQDLGSPPKQAHQVLFVKITDVNDNEPYFERGIDDPPMSLYVEEEVPRDHLVGTIRAVDKDVGQNALIGYDIIEGNHQNLFRLSYEPSDNSSELGANLCRIYSTGRLDRESRESYLLTIKASSISKLRSSFAHQFRDPLGARNPFNQYNASDLTKIRVNIILVDINDNRPVFNQENAKSVVDSSAEVYSQLMVLKATDADSSNSDIQYSIVDALYYSDSRYQQEDANTRFQYSPAPGHNLRAVSMRHVFDIDPKLGILRNSVSLRPYIDGYFEVLVKADSGHASQQSSFEAEDASAALGYSQTPARRGPDFVTDGRCHNSSDASHRQPFNLTSTAQLAEVDNCYTTITKATVFITHQRETFRFVFNKTKLNDRLDEFKGKIQRALEEIMFESNQPQASTDPRSGLSLESSLPKAERVYLNTLNTDFYEREDGSLDFSTMTSCSQLVKFDDRSSASSDESTLTRSANGNNQVPNNQVINYDEVLSLLKMLNSSQLKQQKGSLFQQYGLLNIERCQLDRTTYRMTLSERLSLYFAMMIALVGALLALIVSKMRKSYERNLRLLQRSKYQYMNQCATLAPSGMQTRQQAHHMSLASLPPGNFIAPASAYAGSQIDFDGPAYDTWQL